jgi:hypothetical protein
LAIRFARSALRHSIGEDRARHVIEHCPDPIYPSLARSGEDDRVLFLGPDQHGVPLEVLAVELAGGELLVIHVMRMRRKYRRDYEMVMTWRRRS